MKMFNIKGIVILIALFVAVQIISAFLISPLLGPVVIEAINKHSGTKISIDKVTVWPLTLSCSLKGLKVFDPDNEKERIALVQSASFRLSLLGLLSKRLVISRLVVSGAEIDVKGEPDGSFNVQKIARSKEDAEKAETAKTSALGQLKGKKDWFSRIYNMVKQKSSKETAEKKEVKRVERAIDELPRGRRVRFVTPSDRYIFQIQNFIIKNSRLKLETDVGETVDIDKVAIYIKNLRLTSAAGARFDKLGLQGIVSKDGKLSGNFDLDYAQSFKQNRQTTICDLSAKDVDLPTLKFIYADSLPVDFEKGIISINSRTNIVDGELDSTNSLTLKGHTILPKNSTQVVAFVPLPVICDALNKLDPAKMKFQITGTVDQPQFKGFQDILINLIKPYIGNITEGLKKDGLKALDGLLKKETKSSQEDTSQEESTTSKTIDSIKSLF